MDLQLTDVSFRCGNSEKTLSSQRFGLVPKEAGKEPEDKWHAVVVNLVEKLKLPQALSKDVWRALVTFTLSKGFIFRLLEIHCTEGIGLSIIALVASK